MGESKREFVNVRMSMECYDFIPYSYRKEMELKSVDESGWEEAYKQDEQWLDRKRTSDTAFRELKKREFDIRNKYKGMNLKKIDNVELDNINTSDYPDFVDAYIVSADYNGKEMTEEQLDEINENNEFVQEQVQKLLF
jgi:hypothetical protein